LPYEFADKLVGIGSQYARIGASFNRAAQEEAREAPATGGDENPLRHLSALGYGTSIW
jgi:hypothetical protein